MANATRCLFGMLILLGIARLLFLVQYWNQRISYPLETYHLEAKFVDLARRSMDNQPLYPQWRSYPHVVNFFGPVYPMLAGAIGKWRHSDLDDLFRVCRWISLLSCLVTGGLMGSWAGERWGFAAGVIAALFTFDPSPLAGFSMMARPDTLADMFGFAGFVFATRKNRLATGLGILLLIAAILTKQTAGVFALAAVVEIAMQFGFRRAFVCGLILALLLGACIYWFTLREPEFFRSLFMERKVPLSFAYFHHVLSHIFLRGPSVLLLPIIAILFWSFGGKATRPLLAFALILFATTILLSQKIGSEVNYFISLRLIEAAFLGWLWHAVTCTEWNGGVAPSSSNLWRDLRYFFAVIACLAACVPGLFAIRSTAQAAADVQKDLRTGEGQKELAAHRELWQLVGDADASIFSDSDMINARMGNRAAFTDHVLFRILFDLGELDLREVLDRIQGHKYELLILKSDVFDSVEKMGYWFLPPPVLIAIQENYTLKATQAGFFLYAPRKGTGDKLTRK